MSLYLKYRPSEFAQLKGNEEVIEAVKGFLKDESTCPHVFLLHGPSGCGKTTIGRIIANKLGCTGGDYREVDSADFRGIDTIRDIRRNSQFMPVESKVRVWLIDECHKLTNDAQNALLKGLEDTPPHVFYILCTTEPHKLLDTIKGRCIILQVKPLTNEQMFGLLRRIVHDEAQTLDKEIYEQIIQDSLGRPRNAINILEQVLVVPAEQRLEIAKQAAEQQSQVIELCRALLKGSSWAKVSGILVNLRNMDAEDIRRMVLGYCQATLLKSDVDMAAAIIEAFWEPTYNIGFPGVVYACYTVSKH